MTSHLTMETLNDLVDGRLSPEAARTAQAHLTACTDCAAQWHALRTLVTQARELPAEVAPPPNAWGRIHSAIDAGKRVQFPAGSRRDQGVRVTRSGLMVAAAVLIVLSSGTTALLLRGPRVSTVVGATDLRSGAPTGRSVTPASVKEVAAVEREFVDTADELRATLDAERARLSPETVATVERSLRVIDEAIKEARQALWEDPANAALRDVLRNNHRQKIDFLRRATALVERA
ncbi:MAG: hypothetical protein U0132_19375 [Gemmatimonadaceae bacterium]